MEVFVCLVISYADSYSNASNSYNVKIFKTDEERLKYLVEVHKDMIEEYEIDCVIKNKSYDDLRQISRDFFEGEYVETILGFELYEYTI